MKICQTEVALSGACLPESSFNCLTMIRHFYQYQPRKNNYRYVSDSVLASM